MDIIKRKKGKQEYYYLRYGFKKNGKTLSKEKYLGREIPSEKELENLKKELMQEQVNELNKKLNLIKDNFQKEWKTLPPSAREKELEQIAVAFTYNTNAIEGSKITLEETREIIEDNISPNKPLRDVKETEAHAKVFLDMLRFDENINKDILLNWHMRIFGESKSDIAGRFRDHLVRVGDYLAPDWQDVDNLMKEFFNFIKISKSSVEFAARVHYRFEKIHPFADGNGRIGRLLMNYILWNAGYPMIIIQYKQRRSYYRALKKDEDNFVKYFIRRYLAIHKKR